METDEPTIHWFRMVVSYITTGASGNSFGPATLRGKCVASSRDTASIPLITPASKFPARKSVSISWQIFSQPGSAHLGVNAAVGNDLDVAVGEQEIDQHAVIVRGVPDAELRENIQRPLPRRLIAKQRRAVKRAFDHETQLSGVGGLA